jgi:hypothetical protein
MDDRLRNYVLIPSIAVISLAFGAQGLLGAMSISLVSGAFLYFWRWPRRYLVRSAWLAFNCAAVALALGPGTQFPEWLQAGILLIALAAWDVDAFCERVRRSSDSDRPSVLIRQHLFRLGWVLGAAGFLVFMALTLEISIGFWPAILLAGTIVAGVSALVGNLRSR